MFLFDKAYRINLSFCNSNRLKIAMKGYIEITMNRTIVKSGVTLPGMINVAVA